MITERRKLKNKIVEVLESKKGEGLPSAELGGLIVDAILEIVDDTRPRPVHPVDAERLYREVTGQITMPGDQRRALNMEIIIGLIREYGEQEAKRRLEAAFRDWTMRKGKDGRGYSRINTGWIDWAMDSTRIENQAQAVDAGQGALYV